MGLRELSLALLVALLCISGASAQNKRCRALVLESGGDLGAYEAGVVKGLVDSLPADEAKWDVITGISVGSINAMGISQFAQGDEKNMANWLIDLWYKIGKEDVYKPYIGGILTGLLYERGIYNTAPLKKTLQKQISKPPARKIVIGSTNAIDGTYHIWTEKDSQQDLIDAVMCSTAVPVLFPYQDVRNAQWMDGGVIHMMDIVNGIERCREIVSRDEDIDFYIVFAATKYLDNWDTSKSHHSLEVFTRYNRISDYKQSRQELILAQQNNPKVNFKQVIAPSKSLPNEAAPFFFNKEQVNTMIQQGISDAKAAVHAQTNLGVSSFDKVLNESLHERHAFHYPNGYGEKEINEYNEMVRTRKERYMNLTAEFTEL